jgi:indolepyruvate ferredoxin oxidoreductase
VRGLDQTGLSQKGGPVVSDLKIASAPIESANKVSAGAADLYLGFDLLVATDPNNLDKAESGRTIAVVSTSQIPTGQMVVDTAVHFPELSSMLMSIDRVTRKDPNVYLDAQAMAEALFGDHMAVNPILLGAAYQAGALPISAASIEKAIRLNGVSIEMNLLAFRWGRMAVIDRSQVESAVAQATARPLEQAPVLSAEAQALVDRTGATAELRRLLEIRVPELIAYQDAAYAGEYVDFVARVAEVEAERAPGQRGLAEATARYLYKLMAYKDEYEVARLHTDPVFLARLDAQFKNGYTVKYNLAPPMISKRDPVTGELQKRQFGPWMRSAFRTLAKFKNLRGGALDFFGNTEERRHERQLIDDYIKQLDEICAKLSSANHAFAVQLASVPDEIRGYGHVKERSLKDAKALEEKLLHAFRNAQAVRVAA